MWRNLWYDGATGRVRSGWRVLVFLLVMFPVGILAGMFVIGCTELLGVDLLQAPAWQQLLLTSVPAAVAAVATGVWALRTLDHLPAVTLGITPRGPWAQHLGLGFAAGLGLIALYVVILLASGLGRITWQGFTGHNALVLLGIVGGALVAAAAEELFARGYPLQTLLRGPGPLVAILITSAIFALGHLDNPGAGPIGLGNILVAGAVFALLYLRSGTLWPVIGLHAGWNVAMLLFGLPVSGLTLGDVFRAPLVVTATGPAWFGGGAFGPEGGIIVSVLLLGAAALLTYTRHGLPLTTSWWEWHSLWTPPRPPQAWDFTVDGRAYQWKLLPPDPEP